MYYETGMNKDKIGQHENQQNANKTIGYEKERVPPVPFTM